MLEPAVEERGEGGELLTWLLVAELAVGEPGGMAEEVGEVEELGYVGELGDVGDLGWLG